MAKRKSTDKTSTEEPEGKVETDKAADQPEVSETSSEEIETAAEDVEAVHVYASNNEASDTDGKVDDVAADDVIEQLEPSDDEASDSTDEVDSETDSQIADSDATAEADDHLTEEEAERLIEEAESGDSSVSGPVPQFASETPPIAPQVIKETTIERKGGLVPMVLGGAAAAVLGYGVAAYSSQAVWPFDAGADTGFEEEIRDTLTTQDSALSELGSRIATLEGVEPPTVDLTPMEEQIASALATASDLSARLDEIVVRIDTLERQPLEAAVSEEAIAAYERALADLQAEVEAQRTEVAQMAQEAVAAEENAEGKAQLAASRAALAEITSALDTGGTFSGAIGVLSSNGVEIPDALAQAAESGIPTLSGLIEAFPDAARAALSEARSADTEGAEGLSRISTFFANQLGARSVAPKDGDGPDAVLSRAEAAVRSGDLSTALSELSAMPEIAQAALSDWQAGAQKRLEAKTAADALVQQLLQK